MSVQKCSRSASLGSASLVKLSLNYVDKKQGSALIDLHFGRASTKGFGVTWMRGT